MIPDHVQAAFVSQAKSCDDLGSPFMAQLCHLFASRPLPASPLRDRIYGWEGDMSPRADSVPLRLCGAFHALKLNGGAGLRAVYPPHAATDDALWAAIVTTSATQTKFIDRWIDSPPQTNEVRRAAVLIAAGHWLAQRFGLPMQVTELGASGGLNLMWDHFALEIADHRFGPDDAIVLLTPDWTGALPPANLPKIIARQGVDLNPLNPKDADDALRLRAYLWPDQPDRISRTQAAIAINAVTVEKADAIDWLATHLDHPEGSLHLIYSTIAWQYFPKDAQARGAALIAAAGADATTNRPLAWFGMEPDNQTPGAALTLRLWPGDLTIPMGRVDFHGRWVNWQPPL